MVGYLANLARKQRGLNHDIHEVIGSRRELRQVLDEQVYGKISRMKENSKTKKDESV